MDNHLKDMIHDIAGLWSVKKILEELAFMIPCSVILRNNCT